MADILFKGRGVHHKEIQNKFDESFSAYNILNILRRYCHAFSGFEHFFGNKLHKTRMACGQIVDSIEPLAEIKKNYNFLILREVIIDEKLLPWYISVV